MEKKYRKIKKYGYKALISPIEVRSAASCLSSEVVLDIVFDSSPK
jgi:hypothetical protein